MLLEIRRISPAGHGLDNSYHTEKRPDAQSPSPDVSSGFLDAMRVRVAVYVDEQLVPLANEYDADDSRAHHFVAYDTTNDDAQDTGESSHPTPVGTIRLVPPPHRPHPLPGSVDMASSGLPDPTYDTVATIAADTSAPVPLDLISGKQEPYIKLGRLAVLPSHRKHALGSRLVKAALDYAKGHPAEFAVPQRYVSTATGAAKSNSGGQDSQWHGLVAVHAQAGAIERFWAKFGFVTDPALGGRAATTALASASGDGGSVQPENKNSDFPATEPWWEEGIAHVGMFLRLDLSPP